MARHLRDASLPVLLALALASACGLDPGDGVFEDGGTGIDDGGSDGGSGSDEGGMTGGSDPTSDTAQTDGTGDGESSGGGGSGATPASCGNGMVEGTEECDQNDFGFRDCQTYGFLAGPLTCLDDCSVDPSSCSAEAICGDGSVAGIEQCEADDLAGSTCENLGMGSGELGCTDDCTFDAAECNCAGYGEGCFCNPADPGAYNGCCPAGFKGNEHGACTSFPDHHCI